MLECICENYTQLSWDKEMHDLTEHSNSNTNCTFLSNDEVIMVAEKIRNVISVDTEELQWNETPAKIRKVVKTMLNMYMQNKNNSMFIKLHKHQVCVQFFFHQILNYKIIM